MTLLRLDNVGKSYGGVAALRGLSFTVAAGEIVGLMERMAPARPPPSA